MGFFIIQQKQWWAMSFYMKRFFIFLPLYQSNAVHFDSRILLVVGTRRQGHDKNSAMIDMHISLPVYFFMIIFHD